MELFVSDLDGTLLNSNQEISPCSRTIINDLLAEGIQFSIATARGIESTENIMAPLQLTLPIIISNGAFVYDPIRKVNVMENLLGAEDAAVMLQCLEELGVSFFLFSFDQKGKRHVYYKEPLNRREQEYFTDRIEQGDRRFRRVQSFIPCLAEKVVKLVAIGEEKELRSAYEFLKGRYKLNFDFTQDIYSKAYWLEIANPNANKREALRFLQNYVGAKRLICFGDNLNDCPMFEIADVRLAMSNAHPSLKNMATQVIRSNNENGVAEYLHKWHNQAKLNIACTVENK
jgi:Cof subfamily protein (haloacid dehalogenase superfamily)